METIVGIFVGLVILVLLVVVHELGHAIAARRNGVIVEEFGIGFPPKAWAKKLKNGIIFSLNWLPLGGFVKLKGEYDSANKKGDYGAATFWQKTKILLAGVTINWLVAAILLTILAFTGLPKVLPNQFSVAGDTTTITSPVRISVVQPDYPAAKAGLEKGDAIIALDDQPVKTAEEVISRTKARKGETVQVTYVRGNESERTVSVMLRDADTAVLGAGLDQREELRATWSAPIVGVVTTGQLTLATLQGIGDLIGNLVKGVVLQFSGDTSIREQAAKDLESAGNSVAGPVGILGVIFPQASQAGLQQLTFLTAVISLTLAVMNTLPIPALDGGRWFTMAVFRLLRKPLTKEREEKIQATGFLLLMSLVVIITIADVRKFF